MSDECPALRYERLARELSRDAARARARQRVSDNPDGFSPYVFELKARAESCRKRAAAIRTQRERMTSNG